MSYGLDNLPYASVVARDGRRFAAVRFGDAVLDLTLVDPTLFADGTLDDFLAGGPDDWARVRADATALIESAGLELLPLADVRPVRRWLRDGDEVMNSAAAGSVSLGEVRGRIVGE